MPDFAVEYRRMAKWLADESPRFQYDLNARKERANEIISMVRRVSIDHDVVKADHARVSPLRRLLEVAEPGKRHSLRKR